MQVPPYAMSMRGRSAPGIAASGTPRPGSPGRATNGDRAAASTRITSAYGAPGSLRIHGSSVTSAPRRSRRNRSVSPSGSTSPVKPPSSAVMLVSVARSSIDSARTPGPPNSKTRPTPVPARSAGSASTCSTRSFAVTPRGSGASTSTRRTSGSANRTAPVTNALAMSVVPTPKATQPRAPLCGVCESVPTISMPGRA